jgi:hypothetical protein
MFLPTTALMPIRYYYLGGNDYYRFQNLPASLKATYKYLFEDNAAVNASWNQDL